MSVNWALVKKLAKAPVLLVLNFLEKQVKRWKKSDQPWKP